MLYYKGSEVLTLKLSHHQLVKTTLLGSWVAAVS